MRPAPGPGNERASAAVWRRWSEQEAPSAAGGARRRGLARGVIGLTVAALLVGWKPVLGAVAAALALAILAVALISPRGLYPRVEASLATFAGAVAVAVSWTTLTVIHVLVFFPLGLLLRAAGRLRLARALEPDAPTYWRAPDAARPGPRAHERQF